ncbi:Uncharacterized conserved protein YndB, AHSA1/START domain [Raineyella antarctica]|uniref:Uncharacterized conserved protein YndB, AHSA1/START domain n=1 Tax=Raineyella antarctica TaxID=1577474 RepID=A0A1G6I6G3_9ACTN|nr:SRPBCC domain-containing protein [Raineyella antarctica]SDC02127.1 Uncharacterized conserved protein YndB, AHSA1/START domain [Raineyella antarctica]
MSDFDVTVKRAIHAPADRVWATLTDPALVSKWMMGTTVSSTWKMGASITWTGEYQGKEYTDKGEVVEVEENKRLVHTHFSGMSGAEDKPENYHRLDWKLSDDGDTTMLTLVQSGAHSKEEADQFKQHWDAMLDALRDTAEA